MEDGHICKQRDHKAETCPSKKTSGGTSGKNDNSSKKSGTDNGTEQKFSGNLYFCGEKGHKDADCWMKPENKNKAPSWINVKGGGNDDFGGAAVESVEYVCMTVDCGFSVQQRFTDIFWF